MPWEVSRPTKCRARAQMVPPVRLGALLSETGLRARDHALMSEDQVVPVHHFAASLNPKDQQDIGRGLAADLLGVFGIVSHQASPDLRAVRPTHHHGISACERAVNLDD